MSLICCMFVYMSEIDKDDGYETHTMKCEEGFNVHFKEDGRMFVGLQEIEFADASKEPVQEGNMYVHTMKFK